MTRKPLAPKTIEIERVSKVYRAEARSALAYELLLRNVGRRKRRTREHWALRDVSLSVARGESLGVIGRNGAGKSTLLKIIAGIAVPTSGKVVVRGRIASQLALGAGFHPYLSGRENIFLQGSILGLSNERIRSMFSRIHEYSGIEDAIERPLWTYSTGMMGRLGFAVAAHVDFDLLLLDEALSAGDISFRDRCAETLREFRRRGSTLVVVSHGTQSIVELCDRALWLENGTVREVGRAAEVVSHYASEKRRPEASAE
jgi:ABC-type polysaccharide/polyol phosphate transport system ATPase subunit